MSWYGRGTRHEQGYGYAWTKLREKVLKRAGYLCQCSVCRTSGRVCNAHEVDHIIPKSKGGTDAMSNLQAINRICHQQKTMAEQGKPMQEKVRIGVDGWPIGQA